MEQNKATISFRLMKHNSKIDIDMFDVHQQNMHEIKNALNSHYGNLIRDLGGDKVPNFDILCYLDVVLIYRDKDADLVECKVETSNIFVYDILSLSNSNISGEYEDRKDMAEIFYDQYLKYLDYFEFSQSEDFNQILIQKLKEQRYDFNLDRIEEFYKNEMEFNFNIYMECINFIQHNNFDFQKSNYYYEIILKIIKQENEKYSKNSISRLSNSIVNIRKFWFVNIADKLIDLGIHNKLNKNNKNEVFNFFWNNYIGYEKARVAPDNVASAIQKIVWLFDWKEWEEKFDEYEIMDFAGYNDYNAAEDLTKISVSGNPFSFYSESIYVLFYSFALRPDISEKMSLRLFDIMPEVIKQNKKYEKDTDYISLITKKIENSEISVINLYKILGYLFDNIQEVSLFNQIASSAHNNLGYAFANFYSTYIRRNDFSFSQKSIDNPFNGFGEKVNYEDSNVWSSWENFFEENYSDFNLNFYTSLLLSYVDQSFLNQNTYNTSNFSRYILSDKYIDVLEKGYETYKEEEKKVSEIFNSLITLLDKFPERNKRYRHSRRDKQILMEGVVQKEFIVDDSAFQLLSYLLEKSEQDSDFDKIPYLLLKNESFINNKKSFMKLWDVWGSKHNLREEVAQMDKMPKEVYDNLSKSKSDTVQNRLKPKNEITFIK